jgi:hypothetical protein
LLAFFSSSQEVEQEAGVRTASVPFAYLELRFASDHSATLPAASRSQEMPDLLSMGSQEEPYSTDMLVSEYLNFAPQSQHTRYV